MKLRLAVATMLAALIIAIPLEVSFSKYVWQYDPANYPQIVQWAGCTAAVNIDTDDSIIGSFYIPSYHVMHVGVREDADIPYYAGLIVLLHETQHCLQNQAGLLTTYEDDPVPFELDADRMSAEMACGLGLDGRKLLHDTFQWVHDTFGYNGDSGHGTLEQRMTADDNGAACSKRIEQ